MDNFVVKRYYGKHSFDYLHNWCDQWGTACMLSFDKALKFKTFEEAEQAAVKAQSVCRGKHGIANGVTFKAVIVNR